MPLAQNCQGYLRIEFSLIKAYFVSIKAILRLILSIFWVFPGGSVVKNAPEMQETRISGSERSPGEGNGYPLWYSCLENPTDRGAWQATVHGVTKSWTRLRD